VSCVIPAYNYGSMIAGAIDSALAQDYGAENVEIIVVDDGSTDNTAEVVAPYLDRIRYVRKENGGLVSSFNRGVAESTGEFIAMLDADDEWPADKVRRQIEVFEGRPELGLVYSDLEVVDEHGSVVEPSWFAQHGLTPVRGRLFGPSLKGNYACGGTMMIRASLKHRFHPLPDWMCCQDWPIAILLGKVADADLVDAPLYRYREHSSNMNLGNMGPGRLKLTRRENEIRRWNLLQFEPGQATADDLIGAFASLDGHYNLLMRGLGCALGDLAPVSDEQRDEASDLTNAGVAALREGDRYLAICRLVRAVACDPLSQPTREWLLAAIRTEPRRAALPPVRDFAVLAFAQELVEQPELLAAYGSAFTADDDATLVIYAPGWDDERAGHEILSALGSAGIDEAACADLLAVAIPPDPDEETHLARQVHAVLSNRATAMPFGDRPTFAASNVPDLRALAEQRWSAN
jgi:glycosyltransferase involved in cell wall biosynthesis